jgi:hypothetical protein
MKILSAAAVAVGVLLLTGSAFCQSPISSSSRPGLNLPIGGSSAPPSDPQSQENENAYKSAIEKIPAKQKSDDPWQGIRSSSTQQKKTGR